ncbi:MAG TPA: SRPBCC domain-containing protein, partial [Rhizomicrobium sp.]|nr:SRPBCC domain-containing protein [Rhizomicrobium sp.]
MSGMRMTRRAAFAGSALVASGAALVGRAAAAPSGDIVPSRAIHMEPVFAASPAKIYAALLDGKQFAALTGRKAEIDPAIGGAFSLFDGVIFGRTLAKAQDRLLVQAWSDTAWREDFFSIVRFELQQQGAGTKMTFDHTGFPLDVGEDESLA